MARDEQDCWALRPVEVEASVQRFDRFFQFWRYEVGHGQLLLRSPISDAYATRIDIGFADVSYVQLPRELFIASLVVGSRDDLPAELHWLVDASTRSVFVLVSSGFRGLVVAGTSGNAEDRESYGAPSTVLPALRF